MSFQASQFFKFLVFFCFVVFSNHSMAQEKMEYSEELKEANLSIYQDAPKAIAISKGIYEKATSVKIKITALITLVNAYNADNQKEQALYFATKALDLAADSGNVQFQIWSLGLLGEQYQLSHLNTISREYLEKAEDLLAGANLSKIDIAVTRGNIYAIKANGYKDEIDCEFAIKNYDLAIASYLSIAEESAAKHNWALVYLEKGNCLLDLHDLAKAEKNFRLSLGIAEQNRLKEYKDFANLGLAKILSKRGQFQISVNRIQSIFNAIDSIPQKKLKYGIYTLLANNFLALDSLDSYRSFNAKSKRTLKEMNFQENQQFQQVIKFVEDDAFSDKMDLRIGQIIFYILILILLFILFFEIYKRRKRS